MGGCGRNRVPKPFRHRIIGHLVLLSGATSGKNGTINGTSRGAAARRLTLSLTGRPEAGVPSVSDAKMSPIGGTGLDSLEARQKHRGA